MEIGHICGLMVVVSWNLSARTMETGHLALLCVVSSGCLVHHRHQVKNVFTVHCEVFIWLTENGVFWLLACFQKKTFVVCAEVTCIYAYVWRVVCVYLQWLICCILWA